MAKGKQNEKEKKTTTNELFLNSPCVQRRDANESFSIRNLLIPILKSFIVSGFEIDFSSDSKLALWFRFHMLKKLKVPISVSAMISVSISVPVMISKSVFLP